MPGTEDFSGVGLLLPFQRDQKEDFANGSGDALYRSHVAQVLGTRADGEVVGGELEWRTDFGSRFYLLQQQRNTAALQALAEFYAQEAFDNWLPELRLRAVRAERFVVDGRETGLRVHVRFDPPGIAATSTPDGKLQVTVNIAP